MSSFECYFFLLDANNDKLKMPTGPGQFIKNAHILPIPKHAKVLNKSIIADEILLSFELSYSIIKSQQLRETKSFDLFIMFISI